MNQSLRPIVDTLISEYAMEVIKDADDHVFLGATIDDVQISVTVNVTN